MIETSHKQSWPQVYSCLEEQHIPFIVSTAEEEHIDPTICICCRQTPCVSTDSREHRGIRAAHIQNHVRRRKDYKTYLRALKKCGLWQDPVYIARKVELGDRIDAVRERMPKCVVKDVRTRFPNPPGIPYMGHKREWDQSFLPSPFLRASIEKHTLKVQNRFGRVVTSYNFFVCDPTFFMPQILIPDYQNTTKSDPWHQLKFTDPDSITCNTRSRGCDPRYQGDPRSLIPFYDPVTFNNNCKSYILQISFCQSSWYITLPKVWRGVGTPLHGLYRYVRP